MYKKLFATGALKGSMQNGTVRKAEILGAIRNRLYLCSAFGEQQVQNIEY